MWKYNSDYNKWFANDDSISKNDFDYLKQELKATRYYSRILSGATYLPVNNLTNIYDILGNYQSRDWYISADTTIGSLYSSTALPPQHATPIDKGTYNDYSKYLTEYGLTLKNLFTPNRLIKDASKNFYYVDAATTEQIDLTVVNKTYVIDNVLLVEGHRVLVKDQKINVVLLSSADPNTYFTSNYTIVQDLGATIEYQYSSEENGIYRYTNGTLVREADLDIYEQCVRYSVSVKKGSVNANKQYHLSRLLNGYYPTTLLAQPIEFIERHNWILRNRVDYNNLFEINYYDIIKHDVQSYVYQGFTYSIPERTIAIGEFGIILNTQESKSNIIKNKYKVNLRSISQTSQYYWICGDENTLLRVRKHDFNIDRILLEEVPTNLPKLIKSNLTSVSFYNDLVGVVVGELNTILYTKNAGSTWERIEVDGFSEYNYNKVIYSTNSSFYVAGNVGVLIEFVNSISGWTAYKRRVSQIEDSVDEYLLVENINDMYKTNISTWGVSYSYYTQSIPTNKELLFLVTNNNKLVAYDINNSFSQVGSDFIYFDFGQDYKDIRNIKRKQGTNIFYFTGTDPISGHDGIFSFNISSFSTLGTGSSYSNTAAGTSATLEYIGYPNQLYDYNGTEMLICGNTSLLGSSTYSTLSFSSLDSTFEEKLKSKMLVVDYDIASKLNFFTDAGDYRLPNSITFSNFTLSSTNAKIGFKPIQHNQTSTNSGTYSETNWLTYWKDTQKTFEYYTNTPLDETKTVLISTTFSYYVNPSSFTHSSQQITGSASQMAYLSPSILYATHSRYFNQGTTIASPSVAFDIYLYDYLMVYRVLTSYPVNIGDILKFESSVVDTDLLVNKIVTFGSYKYLYMETDFNQNIINNIQSISDYVTITNLNRYTSVDDLKNRFNNHPISNAYRLDYIDSYGNVTSGTSTVFQISARFNNLTSYYNLQTSVNVGANTQVLPYTVTYQFSGGVSYSVLTNGTTYSFIGGVSASNTISPVAGNGLGGFTGDGGPAILAKINDPIGISYDMLKNLYIVDNANSRIRKVDGNTGIISTIAGSSLTPGVYSGDGTAALTAGLENPIDVAVDMNGDIYIVGATGSTNHVIRKINSTTGKIDVYAGSAPGSPGYNSASENAPIFDPSVQFNGITGICYSIIGLGGGPFGGACLYIADYNNHLVRQIDITTGLIRTVAGDMTLAPGYTGDGGNATAAKLRYPYSVTTDNFGNLYIADSGNYVIRKVDVITGNIDTVAGNGTNGYTGDGGLATSASLGTTNGITFDVVNNLYISSNDGVNKTIRVVNNLTGRISTLTILPAHAFKLASFMSIPYISFSVKNGDIVESHDFVETSATVSGILTFLPNNGDTVLLKLNGTSTTFTFKTSPTLSNDVLIDSTILGCLNNLKTKIEASTAYSTYLIYAEIVSGNTLILTVTNGYGDIPNNNSNWSLIFFKTITTNEVSSILSGSMSVIPVDNNTAVVTINSITTTYTFKNSASFSNPTEVQIGPSVTSTLTNLLKGITTSYVAYISSTSSITGGDTINLRVKSGYGSIPNANSNWQVTYNLTTTSSYVTTNYDMIYTSGFLKFGYSPTYNLMDYLTGLNNPNDVSPKFYATKEYLSMPVYKGIPLDSLTYSTAYIDYNGMTASYDLNSQGNRILFGAGLKFEYDTILINTFVDVVIHGSAIYTTEKLLVMNKYYDSLQNAYVIEFHKRLNFALGDTTISNGGTLDIISRRTLSQISDDLQELNNIQRSKMRSNSWKDQDLFKYDNYQNELNFKIPTDSYAKVLLSDSDTIQQLSAIIYIDYKNELAMNITKLAKEYNVPILNTSMLSGTFSSVYYTDKLYISCSERHDLVDGEGVVLEFTGGAGSSQDLNPQYAGYHVVIKINEYEFLTDIDYANVPTAGSDIGYVKYTKQDPFLNYQPVDLIELGVDGKGKMSLELSIENLKLSNSIYSLINVDFEKYRFRLLDGLNIDTVNLLYSWLLEAELSGAVIGLDNKGGLVWYKGTWLYGRWFGGTWQSGVWMAGDWYGGTWNANTINDKILTVDVDTKTVDLEQSFWYDGRWFDGTWNAGIWNNGRWYAGTWNSGMWHKGIWNDGIWNNGHFEGGIWILGTWNGGVFSCTNEPAYWLDGKWYGGDFENGMWYNGTWEQRKGLSRFGTKAYNSRTANWQAGKWISGSFYSDINTDDNGHLIASDVNKYSIWKTGQWFSGEWYGGIAYNMDFKTGTWYGGILEDIEVIEIDTVNNTITLNGVFYFNAGDNIFIIDNLNNNAYSPLGSDSSPGSYLVLYASQDTTNLRTTVYINQSLSSLVSSVSSPIDTGLKVVSKFSNLNWKGGIWTNGIYDSGLWEGGIWYNGVFNAIWT